MHLSIVRQVLIFSQMTKVLDLIQSYLEQRGHDACRIDGSIKWQDRQAAIKAFNEDKVGGWMLLDVIELCGLSWARFQRISFWFVAPAEC